MIDARTLRRGGTDATGGGEAVQRTHLAGAVIGILIVVVVTLAALIAHPGGGGSVSADPSGASTQGVIDATGQTTEVTVRVAGMSFTPSSIDVPVGNRLTVTFENTGDQRHDLVFANGAQSDTIAPGASTSIDVGIIDSDLEGWCSLPGHRQMGMEISVKAVGAGDTATPETHDMGSTASSSNAPSMAELSQAAEAAKPYDATLPELDGTTDHAYTFTVTESTEEIADGLTRAVWTYNGSSPGPILHGKIGDTFRITLVNAGTMGHSIDFHAGELAPDQPMRTIEPGESLEYTFTAERSGIWMYHCSTMPMSNHIANGMFGAVVIEPEGLPAVDRSYVVVQSEIYLGGNGEAADSEKVAAQTPDVVTFNGKAFQYDAHPLTARVGERVRIWVLDAGPNASGSFHVVGSQFDTVWSEGAYSVYRGASTDGITAGVTGAQVLPLQAAQGGFVELVPTEAGSYAFVNHQMSLAEKGAHGILVVE